MFCIPDIQYSEYAALTLIASSCEPSSREHNSCTCILHALPLFSPVYWEYFLVRLSAAAKPENCFINDL